MFTVGETVGWDFVVFSGVSFVSSDCGGGSFLEVGAIEETEFWVFQEKCNRGVGRISKNIL